MTVHRTPRGTLESLISKTRRRANRELHISPRLPRIKLGLKKAPKPLTSEAQARVDAFNKKHGITGDRGKIIKRGRRPKKVTLPTFKLPPEPTDA